MLSSHTILSLIHIIVIAPLLFIIATTAWIPPMATAALGAFVSLYHAYKASVKIATGMSAWVNILHAAVIGPILFYKGVAPDGPRWVSEIILMFAFAAVGYHGYYLIGH
jgi:hypothetical protein